MYRYVLAIALVVLFSALSSSGPYYPPCDPSRSPQTCSQDLGHSGRPSCLDRCSSGPARLTPTHVDVCENQVADMNMRVDGDALSTGGDAVIYQGANVDWDDGQKTENLPVMGQNGQGWTTNQNISHAWKQATTYSPSVLYFVQHKYDGAGSCSYECRLSAQASVIVHMAGAPECVGGQYHTAADRLELKKVQLPRPPR